MWLDLDIKSRWRHNWKSAQLVNSHLVCDPTIQQPGFDLPRQQWSPLNRFHTEQGRCGACRRKWRLTDTDLCLCDETQTMSHIVESCPLTKLNGGLSRLHSADKDTVSWLTSCGSWNVYEKKKNEIWHRGGCPRGSYVGKVWSLKFKGCKFYRGLKFRLLHWLYLWALTQCNATALPVMVQI